ncbi:embryo defective 1674-like protein [Tanacetum coccineum]
MLTRSLAHFHLPEVFLEAVSLLSGLPESRGRICLHSTSSIPYGGLKFISKPKSSNLVNLMSNKTPVSSNRCLARMVADKGRRRIQIGRWRTLGPQGMRLFGSASTGKRYNLKTNENEIQVFGSAEISKRLNNNTVEAQDGILITIIGCINRSRTLSNGISHEVSYMSFKQVCNRFTSGFPYNWEEYDAKSVDKKCDDTAKRSFPVSFDDLPVTRNLTQSTSLDSLEKVSSMISETELDQKQSTVFSLNSTSKIIREAPEIQSCQVEDGGFMSNAPHEKNIEEAQANECNTTTISGHKRRLTRSQTKI